MITTPPPSAESSIPAASALVYVVDDDLSVRAALQDLLASVGLDALTFDSTAAFLAHARADVPACVVLDVRMPGQSGLAFQRQMIERDDSLPVIFITGHGDIPMSVQAMKQGALEFLTKPFRDQDLLDAIERGIALDRVRRACRAKRRALQARWDSLTPGEQDVARMVVQGLLNKQIAARLQVSEITVKVRRGQAMRKMAAASLADLVRMLGAF